MRFLLAALLSGVLGLSAAMGQEYQIGETAALVKNMPGDVADVIARADSCLHWAGEEAFDDERATEIEKAEQ